MYTFTPREQAYTFDGRTLIARVEPLFLDANWNTIVARFSLREKHSQHCLLGGTSSPVKRVPDFMNLNYLTETFPSLPFSPQKVYSFFAPLTQNLQDNAYQ